MRFPIKFLLSLIFVTPVVAFSQTKITSKDLRIISASVSDFSSGAAREGSEGTRGAQYEIKAVIKAKNGIVIDSLITEKGVLPVETVVGLRRSLSSELVKKSDTVQVVARFTNDKSVSPLSKETRTTISKLTKAKQYSFLVYRSNGKRCLVPVSEFRKTVREQNQ